jgi:hypothetical protein
MVDIKLEKALNFLNVNFDIILIRSILDLVAG